MRENDDKKTIREKIDAARTLCVEGDYKGALALVGQLFKKHEGATQREISEISALRKFLSEKISEERVRNESK